jgi:hypothetical protein
MSMRKLMTAMMLAGLVMIPVVGMTAGAASTPAEIASAAVARAEAAVQSGLETLAKAQKASDEAVANLDKAKADLRLAEASGDKDKIKAATDALQKAKWVASQATRRVSHVTDLVDRLKVILEKAKEAAQKVAQAKTPEEAKAAAAMAELQAAKAGRILKSIDEVMKPRPRLEIIGMTIPTTTTSTTKSSPTPIGFR